MKSPTWPPCLYLLFKLNYVENTFCSPPCPGRHFFTYFSFNQVSVGKPSTDEGEEEEGEQTMDAGLTVYFGALASSCDE